MPPYLKNAVQLCDPDPKLTHYGASLSLPGFVITSQYISLFAVDVDAIDGIHHQTAVIEEDDENVQVTSICVLCVPVSTLGDVLMGPQIHG